MDESAIEHIENAPSPGLVRLLLVSAIENRPPALEPRDAFMLVAQEIAADVVYAQFLGVGVYSLADAAFADIMTLANVVACAPGIAMAVGFPSPFGVPEEEKYWWTIDRILDWNESLIPDTARWRVYHRLRREIESAHGVGPDHDETEDRMVALLCGSLGEDFDPAHHRPLNGEFADLATGDTKRWELVSPYLRALPDWSGWSASEGEWEESLCWTGRGITINPKVYGRELCRLLGHGRARSSREVITDPQQVRAQAEPTKIELDAETIGRIRDLRDELEGVELLRDLLDDSLRLAGAEGVERALALVERVATAHSANAHDPALQAALLYELGRGTRAELAEVYHVTTDAIRYRADEAKAIVSGARAA